MAWTADFTNKLCWRLKALGAPKVQELCFNSKICKMICFEWSFPSCGLNRKHLLFFWCCRFWYLWFSSSYGLTSLHPVGRTCSFIWMYALINFTGLVLETGPYLHISLKCKMSAPRRRTILLSASWSSLQATQRQPSSSEWQTCGQHDWICYIWKVILTKRILWTWQHRLVLRV